MTALVESVLTLKRHPGAEYLFYNRQGEPRINDKGEIRDVNTIWQLAMKKALQMGIRKEKFTMHDRRGKAPSDISPEGARDLLKHTTVQTTAKPYRRLPAVLSRRKNL